MATSQISLGAYVCADVVSPRLSHPLTATACASEKTSESRALASHAPPPAPPLRNRNAGDGPNFRPFAPTRKAPASSPHTASSPGLGNASPTCARHSPASEYLGLVHPTMNGRGCIVWPWAVDYHVFLHVANHVVCYNMLTGFHEVPTGIQAESGGQTCGQGASDTRAMMRRAPKREASDSSGARNSRFHITSQVAWHDGMT